MPSSRDYVPVNDAELNHWVANFRSAIAPLLAEVGLVPANIQPLTNTHDGFDGALTDWVAKQAAARSSLESKKLRRRELEETLRPLVRQINNHTGMTNEIRALLGLHIPSVRQRRIMAGSDVPGMFLETRQGMVIVHFGTDPSNEQINGKPAWARGCNIYRKRADESEFGLIAFDMASPYVDMVNGPAVDVTYPCTYCIVR